MLGKLKVARERGMEGVSRVKSKQVQSLAPAPL